MPVTPENIDDVFTYHAPDDQQRVAYEQIRDGAKALARIILEQTPKCGDQQAALRLLREAVMTANAAVALHGGV